MNLYWNFITCISWFMSFLISPKSVLMLPWELTYSKIILCVCSLCSIFFFSKRLAVWFLIFLCANINLWFPIFSLQNRFRLNLIQIWAEEVDKHALGFSLLWKVCAIGSILLGYPVIWFHLVRFLPPYLSICKSLFLCMNVYITIHLRIFLEKFGYW